jgi:hypothetical protein
MVHSFTLHMNRVFLRVCNSFFSLAVGIKDVRDKNKDNIINKINVREKGIFFILPIKYTLRKHVNVEKVYTITEN